MALATLAQLKEYLDVTQTAHDARLTALLDRATAVLERLAGRKFAASDVVEFHDGSGTAALLLRHYPVVSVASLHDDAARVFGAETLIPPADYVVESASGLVTLSSRAVFTKGVRNIRAAYRAGYEIAPPDLQMACLLLAATLFEERKNVGLESRSMKDGATAYRHGIPEEVLKMLAPYERRNIG